MAALDGERAHSLWPPGFETLIWAVFPAPHLLPQSQAQMLRRIGPCVSLTHLGLGGLLSGWSVSRPRPGGGDWRDPGGR